jgi:hypothetical protein
MTPLSAKQISLDSPFKLVKKERLGHYRYTRNVNGKRKDKTKIKDGWVL